MSLAFNNRRPASDSGGYRRARRRRRARLLRQHARPPRPYYVLINETGQHDYDRAFTMSLKLAEKKSGIENALVLLASLPPSQTIEQMATALFTQPQSARGATRAVCSLLVQRQGKICWKIEVSYALGG